MGDLPGERLQAVALGSVANAVMITEVDGTVVWVNEAFSRMSGYAFEEAVGATPRLLKSGKHGDEHYAGLWETILAGRVWRGEVVDRRKDGELYTVFQTVTPILDEQGVPSHFVAVHEDVTELRSSQARLQAMFDHAADAIVLVDCDGRVSEANPAACAFVGWEPEELVGTPARALLADEAAGEFDAVWARLLREGRWRGRTVARRSDGGRVVLAYQAVASIVPGAHLFIAQDETARWEAEEQREFQAQLLDAVGDAVVATDLGGVVRYWNPAAERLYGWSAVEAVGREVGELVASVSARDRVEDGVARVRAGGVWSGEVVHRRRDGATVSAWVTYAPYYDARGEVAGVIGVASDIGELKRTHAELARRVGEQEVIAEFASQALVSSDARELAARAEAHLSEMLGAHVTAQVLWGPASTAEHAGGSGGAGEAVRVPIADSGALVVRARAGAALEESELHVVRTLAHVLDAAVQRADTDAQLRHLATHDPVTGLPNRVLLLDRLEHARAGCERSGGLLALVSLDFDGFKFVNDALGHDTGDEILVQLARRLREAVRPTDTVARIGGDEFAVLCPEVPSEAEATRIAERIRAVFDAPLGTAETEVMLTASIGLVLGDQHDDPRALVRDADTAMYWAKDAGRNRVQRFDQHMQHRAIHRVDVTSALRHAIDHDEVEVRYQPWYELATGRLAGAEALARLPVPGGTTLTPDQFIWVAEDAGLIAELGHAVLTRACADASQWLEARPGLMLSVNLSPRELTHPRLPDTIEQTLADTGVPASSLWLEITESGLLTGPGVHPMLQHLRDLGVHLAVDDFGTGYSSLAHLRRIPAGMLKIDRSFVANITTNTHEQALVTAAVDLAEAFGLATTGEGIETPQQRDVLTQLGCTYGQGFLWNPPVPAHQLNELVTSSDGRVGPAEV